MAVDFTKLDTYPDLVVPDEHVEIALRVIRTVRDAYLRAADFDPTLILCEAHKAIVSAVDECEQDKPHA